MYEEILSFNHVKLILRILSIVIMLYTNDYFHGYNEDKTGMLDISLSGAYHKSSPEKDVTY